MLPSDQILVLLKGPDGSDCPGEGNLRLSHVQIQRVGDMYVPAELLDGLVIAEALLGAQNLPLLHVDLAQTDSRIRASRCGSGLATVGNAQLGVLVCTTEINNAAQHYRECT